MLKSMVLKYYHDAVTSAHLGAWKTHHWIAQNLWWPQMQKEVFEYVHKFELCQREKLAKNQCVGLHAANPVSQTMDRMCIEFVGPLTRTK